MNVCGILLVTPTAVVGVRQPSYISFSCPQMIHKGLSLSRHRRQLTHTNEVVCIVIFFSGKMIQICRVLVLMRGESMSISTAHTLIQSFRLSVHYKTISSSTLITTIDDNYFCNIHTFSQSVSQSFSQFISLEV